MSTVHRAIHDDGGEVALKRLLPKLENDLALARQFEREARIAAALEHPNIVGVREYGEVEGRRFLAMERIEGHSLLTLLQLASRQLHPAPVGVAVWILYQALRALEHAMFGMDSEGKAFQVVHRDLSPSNIILTTAGDVKLIDFGIAKSLSGPNATRSGRIKGKLGYMAPELLRGAKVSARSDVFSISVVAWELCTAQRLYLGGEAEQMGQRARLRHKMPASKINPWVPLGLDVLLLKGMSTDPMIRHQSAREMVRDLKPIMDEQGAGASRGSLLAWMDLLDRGSEVLSSSQTTVHKLRGRKGDLDESATAWPDKQNSIGQEFLGEEFTELEFDTLGPYLDEGPGDLEIDAAAVGASPAVLGGAVPHLRDPGHCEEEQNTQSYAVKTTQVRKKRD